MSSRWGSGWCSGWAASHSSISALDDPAPPERAADVVPTAVRTEVLLQARVVRVALTTAGDLGVDLGIGDRHALGVGDLGQDEQGPNALLGARPELRVHVRVGLFESLEVGLLGDPLPGEGGTELVVHHLDLLVDQDGGQLHGRVRDRVLDDLVGEAVTGAVERIALRDAS